MKLRKLMLCLLTSMVVSGMFGVHTYAAEVTAQVAAQAAATTTTATEEIAETTKETETDLIENDAKTENTQVKKETSTTSTTEKTTATKTTTKKAKAAQSYTKAELRLLSALISCEANGQPYAGKLAVGIVVVNRMESKLFPDTLKGVIYQRYQFGPARNGSLARALKEYDNGKFNSDNEKACIKAAKEALSGVNTVTYKDKKINMKSYLFFSGRVKNARLTIAGHQFK